MNYSWHAFISGCLIPLPAILGNKLIQFNFTLLIKNIFTGEVKWPGMSRFFTHQLWCSDNNGCLLLEKRISIQKWTGLWTNDDILVASQCKEKQQTEKP